MTQDAAPPPGWYADPAGRHQHRYWDGARWTEHVANAGQQSVDASAVPQVEASTPDQVRRQVARAGLGGPAPSSGGGLFEQSVLVVNQKPKLIELTNEFAVYDQDGAQLGSVVQVGQNALRKALRLLTSVDQYLPVQYEVRDLAGRPLLRLDRPAKLFKSTVVVRDGETGREIGRIAQRNVFGKIRFDLLADGGPVGSLNAENWRAWDFAILDAGGEEVARVKKTFAGLLRATFTTADNYVVRVHRPLAEPLRSLVVASALTVDTALKQDDR